MSGGNFNSKKDEPMPGTGATMTQQPFIGDSQNMLAQQLAAGGYGNAPDLMSMLSQTYSPMQVLDTRPGAVATPTTPTTTTPTTGGGNKGNKVGKGGKGGTNTGGGNYGGGEGWSLFSQDIQRLGR